MTSPDTSAQRPRRFAPLWSGFIGAARQDLDRLPKERPLDQYLQWKNDVLDKVSTAEFAQEIDDALQRLWDDPSTRAAAELLEGELRAYAAAVKVAQLQAKSAVDLTAPASLCGAAKTTIDSLREIGKNLPPGIKALLTVLSEVFDIFK